MTKTSIRIASVALVVLAGLPTTATWARNRRCRQSCGPVIAACVDDGGRPRACRRHVLRQCARNSAVCPATTFPPTTTTTLPLGTAAVDLAVASVETLYELKLVVPAPSTKFVRVGVKMTNRTGTTLSPSSPVLYTGGLGYQSLYQYYPPMQGDGSCSSSATLVPPGGALTCSTVFQVPDDSTRGTLGLQVYTAYPPGESMSAEFDIPSVPRPFAALDVTMVTDVSGICSHRPEFQVLQLQFDVESHQGATELTLGGGQWSVVADDARYQPAYCFFPTDPCDLRIGVPTNGKASCSLLFEVPATVAGGRLELQDYRYPASAEFDVP